MSADDRLGTEKVKVKSFDEIMAEKRQRALQKKEEPKKNEEQKPKAVMLLKRKQKESSKPTTGLKLFRIFNLRNNYGSRNSICFVPSHGEGWAKWSWKVRDLDFPVFKNLLLPD